MANEPRELTIGGMSLKKTSRVAAGTGAVLLMAAVALGMSDPRGLWHAWLVSGLFWLSLSLGALFFVVLQHLVRAGWSVVVRRLAEHLAAATPVMAVLVLVAIAAGFSDLFPWANADHTDELLEKKRAWLNPTFFFVRAAVVVAVWTAIALWYRRLSLRQDADGDEGITRRLRAASGPCTIAIAFTFTAAAFDWIMSLDPHWYSTIFGVYFFSGAVVGFFAVVSLLVLGLRRAGHMRDDVTPEHFHDLGKLLFGFVCFWAYIAFSQFMLIWYASIPEETVWYIHRLTHGWKPVTIALAAGHFALPFLLMLPREIKRKPATLAAASVWMLAMHYLDLYWLVKPALGADGVMPGIADLLTLLGIGGMFAGVLAHLAHGTNLVPVNDPRIEESRSFENF